MGTDCTYRVLFTDPNCRFQENRALEILHNHPILLKTLERRRTRNAIPKPGREYLDALLVVKLEVPCDTTGPLRHPCCIFGHSRIPLKLSKAPLVSRVFDYLQSVSWSRRS